MNDTLELVDLEELLTEDISCQSNHDPDGEDDEFPIGPCLVKVVARKYVSCDNVSFFICQNSYNWNRWYLSRYELCECERPVDVCWRVVRI